MKKKLSKLSAILLIAFLVLSVFTPSIGLIGKVFAESGENLLVNPNLDSDKSGWDGDFVYASNCGVISWTQKYQKVVIECLR